MEVVEEDPVAALAAPYTKTTVKRRAAMVAAVRQIDAEGIAGDVVECGVWRGGNIIIARTLSPARICWLYDTFTGMTQPESIDRTAGGHPAVKRWKKHQRNGVGWCEASVGEVERCLEETGTHDRDRLRFVVGRVEETLLDRANLPERIALIRLDTDWYASTKVELEVLYPRLAPGGVLIVDDYGHWQGARKAVDEYFADSGVRFDQIDYTGIVAVKPC